MLLEMKQYDESGRNTILIVDDDAINRAILRKIFSDSFSVAEAVNGRQGLEKILNPKNHYCAVLLDVMMPEMNGIEVVRKMETAGLLKQIPVFLITAEANDKVIKEAYQLGVMDVIKKPYISFVVIFFILLSITLHFFTVVKHKRK